MKNRNKHLNSDSDFEEVLSQFPMQEQADVVEVWQQSKHARHSNVNISENELEEALENVHFRLKEKKRATKSSSNISGFILSNARYLVAAIALIVLSFGFLMVPKTITVPNAEMATLELPDGSSVELNSGSTLRYNRLFAFTNRDISLNGEAYFSVEKGEEAFIVEANGSITQVTGTKFNVRSWSDDPGGETTITVTEGNVEFYPVGDSSKLVSIKAGQSSQLNSEMNSPAQPKTSADESLAWRENRLVFQETPLIVILRDLERSFDVEIELDADQMDYETLTAYYNQPTNIETVLDDICTVKGLRYTKTNNGYRIFK